MPLANSKRKGPLQLAPRRQPRLTHYHLRALDACVAAYRAMCQRTGTQHTVGARARVSLAGEALRILEQELGE